VSENDPKLYDINNSNISEKFTDHKVTKKKIERKLQNLTSRFKPHKEKTFFQTNLKKPRKGK